MAGEVLLQCQVSRQAMPVAREGQVVYILALVRPGEALQSLRFPLNFALVLDRSFSMRGASLQAVKEGVSLLVDALTPHDTLAVVSFKGKADVIVPAQPAQDKAAIKAAVEGMRAWGGTKMSEGLRGGLQELSKYMRPDVVSRMVVLTDGRTSGDEAECREVADQARAWGVGIYPMGLGANWDEMLLDDLGRRSGGMPAEFVQQPMDMLRIFQQQAYQAAAVAVRN
ncbi:MAG TPA: VWA domain-containing protein, partial [Ktedonobacterales bacterium]|nr:VWA domain-containing protein [Ktedonobacterales bacterium]